MISRQFIRLPPQGESFVPPRERARAALEAPRFQRTVIAVILINAAPLGVDT